MEAKRGLYKNDNVKLKVDSNSNNSILIFHIRIVNGLAL